MGYVLEAQSRAADVIAVDLDADPEAFEALGDLAGDVAAGEGVEDQLSRLGQEADEEFRQAGHKAGRVDGQARRPAAPEILVVRARVGELEQIRRDGPARASAA